MFVRFRPRKPVESRRKVQKPPTNGPISGTLNSRREERRHDVETEVETEDVGRRSSPDRQPPNPHLDFREKRHEFRSTQSAI